MDYPLFSAFLTMAFFFLWVLWIFLLVKVVTDIFRGQDLGGWGKAGWLLFVIVLPYLGVFVYLIARGVSMSEREMARAEQREQALQDYVRSTARVPTQADELTKLAQLRDHGDISESDYQKAKAKILT
jgi:hypothetical protein